jgi:hypothetical protein
MGRIPSSAHGEITPTIERYGVKYIRPYHRELARRIVLGSSEKELCNEFHIGKVALSMIVNTPLFQLELMRLEKMRDEGVADVTKTLRDLSPLALDVMERTMYQTKSEGLKVKIAESFLDRAGHGAINKSVVDVTTRADTGYDDLTLDERRRLATERIKRMNEEALEKMKDVEAADGVKVEFEEAENEGEGENGDGFEGFINVD